MDQETGFLLAIRENPKDTVSRLVYADWLEDRDDVRGEFLRLQLAIQTLSLKSPERAMVQQRLQDLRDQQDSSWLDVVEPLALLDLSPRTLYLIEAEGITTIRQLCQKRPEDVLEWGGFGDYPLRDLLEKMPRLGLQLRY